MDHSSKHVVHVPRRFTENSWGGTERVLQQTLPLLREFGYSSSIYTTQALDETLISRVAGIPVTRFPYFYPEWPLSAQRKLRYDNKGGNLLSPSLTRSLLETKDLTLLHCHTANLLAAHCMRAVQNSDVPTVLTLHGGHFTIPKEELDNLAVREKADPQSGFRWGRILSLALRSRQLLAKVNALICVGIDEYEAARKALPAQDVYFLPGGVNLEEFAQADRTRGRKILGLELGTSLIVCVARIDRQKDQATLVKAWANHCNTICDLALVGPETTPGYVEELQALAKGAKGNLHITGGIAPEEIPHIYAAADVSVLPSRHEPFGLACLESWAAGTALVAAEVGGPAWLLKGEVQGRLFPVGDREALGSILCQLLERPEERARHAAEGARRVVDEFGWRIQAKRLSEIYEIAIEKRSSIGNVAPTPAK